jgi:hypothetical protein
MTQENGSPFWGSLTGKVAYGSRQQLLQQTPVLCNDA